MKAKDIINESLVQSDIVAVTQAFELPAVQNITKGEKAKKRNISNILAS